MAACGLVVEAVVEQLEVKRLLLARLEEVVAAETVLGHQHVLAVGDRRRRRAGPSRAGRRAPLLQPGAGDAAGRGRVRRRHLPRCGVRHGRPRRRLGQDTGEVRVDPGVHRQSRRPALLRRGAAAGGRGRCRPRHRRCGGDRVRRVRHGAVRPHGPGRARRQPGGLEVGFRADLLRSPVRPQRDPAGPGGRRSPRSEDGKRVLRVRRRRRASASRRRRSDRGRSRCGDGDRGPRAPGRPGLPARAGRGEGGPPILGRGRRPASSSTVR